MSFPRKSKVVGSRQYYRNVAKAVSEFNNTTVSNAPLNFEILARLDKQEQTLNVPLSSLPRDFPTNLPLIDLNALECVEEYLKKIECFSKLVSFLSSLGGKDITNTTNNILRHILSNEVACSYSYFGKRSNKKAFANLGIKRAVIDAVKSNFPPAKEKDIEDVIKVWLKHSPQRLTLERAKKI
ncbi:hypothetical protein FQR65_LT12741 [Abscondita terminalis]|nr:hypothetical protein FQR65_LT12741 [Abscondita terminalis]